MSEKLEDKNILDVGLSEWIKYHENRHERECRTLSKEERDRLTEKLWPRYKPGSAYYTKSKPPKKDD